jgi:hypothetical protein
MVAFQYEEVTFRCVATDRIGDQLLAFYFSKLFITPASDNRNAPDVMEVIWNT